MKIVVREISVVSYHDRLVGSLPSCSYCNFHGKAVGGAGHQVITIDANKVLHFSTTLEFFFFFMVIVAIATDFSLAVKEKRG